MNALPVEIKRVEKKAVLIRWTDGHEGTYENGYLRQHCQCASCVHEWTGERLVQPSMIAKDIFPVRIDPVGNYAISIHWSDGHDTGIYPFELLRRICPCLVCAQGLGVAK
ncbi:MAG TPA: DUF971 domain-containing protein [Nitrospiria bacterium]|nr:DUF971 domain-containing protein [Nitrospiria bacterium]